MLWLLRSAGPRPSASFLTPDGLKTYNRVVRCAEARPRRSLRRRKDEPGTVIETTQVAAHPSKLAPIGGEIRIVVSATFTAEPVEPYLHFWMKELGLTSRVEFAPYNQIFQELLDPSSLCAANRSGINLVLARLEDWARFRPGGWDASAIEDAADELARSLLAFAERGGPPTILCVPPPSPITAADPQRAALLGRIEEQIRSAIAPCETIHWVGAEALGVYPVGRPYDEVGDRVGHMPYTPEMLAAIATAVARRIHLIKFPPSKVVALDCDHTLWSGVVGEDGPQGITLGPGMKALQHFIVEQQADGMLVCLLSKNSEADVLDAFEARADFPLRREHLVSWRINWWPKSQGLAELAEELNLGLDSFVFLDDNPVECAEVQAAVPQVLTLRVPPDGEMEALLPHLWAFDRLKVTEEDRKRTLMYRQNADRSRLERQAGDISDFLASLELKVQIAPPTEAQWLRVSQLTQRTNQFNFTTVRRSEGEVRQCGQAGLECLCVEVSDRFGEYGLVGVMIFGASGDALAVDTFLLSCRVLGRGVEHSMLAHLGGLAVERGLAFVECRHLPTPKNEPAANFLATVAASYASPSADGDGTLYRIPADVARESAYRPADAEAREQLEFARTGGKPKDPKAASAVLAFDKSDFYRRAAYDLRRPEAVVRAVEAESRIPRALQGPIAEPRTAVQRELTALWGRVLQTDPIGIDDDFSALGGTSLQCARMFVDLETDYGVRLPMSTILDAPTVRLLAERIASASRGEARQSLKMLRPGLPGGPTLFLVHDGDGETLLYLNLARRLQEDVTVYGLEPYGNDHCPMLHTQIPEMAAFYLERVREVCPEGPYLLGGLCAGGVIAFEMALQLRADGQAVGLVALMDSADARAETKPYLNVRRRWARFVASLRGKPASRPHVGGESMPGPSTANGHVPKPSGGRATRLVRKGGQAVTKVSNLVRYEMGLRARKIAEAARIQAIRAELARGHLPEEPSGLTVRAVYEHAERSYTPSARLDVPTLLVRSGGDGKEYASDEPLVTRLRDPRFGWERRMDASIPLEVIDAPGGHGGMLQEPHVSVVADGLRAAIDRTVAAAVS